MMRGSVVTRKTLSGGAGTGLYLGRPRLIDQEVIDERDPLDGSSGGCRGVHREESLNSHGQVAFAAHLRPTAGKACYVATPK